MGFINHCLFPAPETHDVSWNLVARKRTEPSSTWTVMMILSFAMDSVATNLAKKTMLEKWDWKIYRHEMKWLNLMEITCKTLLDIQSYLLRWVWCLIGISFGGPVMTSKLSFRCDWMPCLGSQVSRADFWIALCKQTVQSMTGGKKYMVQTNTLVGGFNTFEKYQSKWESSPNRGENKKNWNHHLARYTLVFQISCQYVFGPPNTSWEGL